MGGLRERRGIPEGDRSATSGPAERGFGAPGASDTDVPGLRAASDTTHTRIA